MAKNNDESISDQHKRLQEYWKKQNQLIAEQYAENSDAIGYWTNNQYEIHFQQAGPEGRAEYVYTYSYNNTPLAYFEFSFSYREITISRKVFTQDWGNDSEEYKLIEDFNQYCSTYAINLYNKHQKQYEKLQNSFDNRNVTFEERSSETQAALQAEVESANGTEESTEQQPQGPQQTTPPESEEANGNVELPPKAVQIINSGTIDSGAGFLNGDTASSQDSDIIDMIANALGGIAGAALQSSITSATSQLTEKLPGVMSGEGSNSNIISAEELGTDVLTSMEGAAMNVINSSGELSNVIDLANNAMNGYETVKNLIKQLPELVPELVLSAVDIITNGILQSIKSNLEAILDPQAIMSQLGYFTSYYTKLYTKGVGTIMSELAMAQDALADMQLDENQNKEKAKKEAKLKKHKERIEKCKEYASYAQSAVEAIVYYSTEGVPMVQKLMSTYCQWIVKKADKYITMGADWLIDRRDEFIEDCGEKIGKKAAEVVNNAVKKASQKTLSDAAVKAKAGLLQGMAMLMMGVQIAVAQLGPLLGKILKIAIKVAIDVIKKQIQKAMQEAMKASIEAAQKAIQETAEKATGAITGG